MRTARVPFEPSSAVTMLCLTWPARKLIDAAPFHAAVPGNTDTDPERRGLYTVRLTTAADADSGIPPWSTTTNTASTPGRRPIPVRVSSTRVGSTGWKVPGCCGVAAVADPAGDPPTTASKPASTMARHETPTANRRMQPP